MRPLKRIAELLSITVEDFPSFQTRLDRLSSVNILAPSYPIETRALLTYPNAVNTLFLLTSQGTAEILELKRRLYAALNISSPLTRYPPYLTLGQTLSDKEYASAFAELSPHPPSCATRVQGFELLYEASGGKWKTFQRLHFSS